MLENKNIDPSYDQVFDRDFTAARKALLDAPFEPDFQRKCHDYGVSLNDTDSYYYWSVMTEYQGERAQDPAIPPQEAYARVVSANSMESILRFAEISQTSDYATVREHKLGLSRFNKLLRSFTDGYPDTKASQLISQLNRTSLATIGHSSHSIQSTAENYIKDVVRGVQHESVFGCILEALVRKFPRDFKFRGTNEEEDLRGADYILVTPKQSIKIDVKASLSQIESRQVGNGRDVKPFAFSPEGNMTIFSGFTDQELKGRFFVTPEEADERLKLLEMALDAKGIKRRAS